jgi:hypothetical protein
MNNQVIIYQTKDGKTHLDVKVDGEMVWLSLLQMVELFERDKSMISRHLNNIFKEGELEKNATVAKFATVQLEGTRQVSREIEFFNYLVLSGLSLSIVGKLLGHTQASTTQRYAHLADAPLREATELLGNKIKTLSDIVRS